MDYNSNIISLRSIEYSDADILYQWENSYDWMNSQSYNPLSKEFIKSYIIKSSDHLSHNSDLTMIIQHKSMGPIGYVQILDYSAVSRRAAVGVFIDEKFRRNGWAMKSLNILINYAFSKLNIRMLYARIMDNNSISKKLFVSIGFVYVGCIPEWEWSINGYVSLTFYQLCNK